MKEKEEEEKESFAKKAVNFLMWVIFILMLLVIVSVVLSPFIWIMYREQNTPKDKPYNYYLNEKFILMEKGTMGNAVYNKFFFIRRVNDTTCFAELKNSDLYCLHDSTFYGRQVGDTIFFKYINKHRFFTIKNYRKK